MDLLTKSFSTKIVYIFTALLLSACGGRDSDEPSTSATASTADLEVLAERTTAQQLVVAPTGFTTNQAASLAAGVPDAGLPGIADLYIGALDLPYYFDPSNSTTSYWLPSLAVRETLNVPVLMAVPNDSAVNPLTSQPVTMPDSGWPIVMFQHGITQDRTNLIAIADSLASVGFASIAIDLPTHGIIDIANPLHANHPGSPLTPANPFPNDAEQTYGQNETSGANFINLTSLLTSRDNVRQGAVNLITLRKSLGGIINIVTGNTVAIDTTKVGLVAHSLGGIIAVDYLGVETTPTPTSILTSGATISDILQGSAAFGPRIEAGLALPPLNVTTPQGIAIFYANAQQLIDAGEPANYAAAAAAAHPIHIVEVINDLTVPNSSTENLATIMGAVSVSSTTPGIAPGNPGIVRFTSGEHGSPLSPDRGVNPDFTPNTTPDRDFLAVTTEIQTQVAIFQATSGTVIQITNGDIIQ